MTVQEIMAAVKSGKMTVEQASAAIAAQQGESKKTEVKDIYSCKEGNLTVSFTTGRFPLTATYRRWQAIVDVLDNPETKKVFLGKIQDAADGKIDREAKPAKPDDDEAKPAKVESSLPSAKSLMARIGKKVA